MKRNDLSRGVLVSLLAAAAAVGCLGHRGWRHEAPTIVRSTGTDSAGSSRAPRTLILAIDGIPHRVLEQARRRGAFDGWPDAAALLSPFPTMTNVSFAFLFEPLGVAPTEGYEIQHFDRCRNRVIGASLFRYSSQAFAWKSVVDMYGRSIMAKLAQFSTPRRTSRHEIDEALDVFLDSPKDVVIAYIGATDGLQHLRGDPASLEFLLRLDERLAGMRGLHEERRGRPSRVVMLSDHGCGREKVRAVGGLRHLLRRADLRVHGRLTRPGDVVARTFGIVSFGALFTSPADAGRAAAAIAEHESVTLSAWSPEPGVIQVRSGEGEAAIRWNGDGRLRRLSYATAGGDPLELLPMAAELQARARLDESGFGSAADWFWATTESRYPDSLGRLVAAFSSERVSNRASVLFSFEEGRAWGWKAAHVGAWVTGGRIEGTHGGLDRSSSLGFFITDDAVLAPAPYVRASEALSAFRPRTTPDRISWVPEAEFKPAGDG